jgi:FMN-dependent oxidoreductase (nitrilotriacetate monooxygenase family)
MSKRLIFNAFVNFSPNHHSFGYWRTPEGQAQYGYNQLGSWIEAAQTLERGKFDALFVADSPGVFHLEHSIRGGAQFPKFDPIVFAAALSQATEHLGFGVTSNIYQTPPFSLARQLSTLDHVSGGRAGWNIVTGYTTNPAQNYGFDTIPDHDERYGWAQEYLDVVYKLWEHSWEEGAIVKDPETNTWFDPEKIHQINHAGARFKVAGPHIVEPSPQGTPLLFQAGNSPAGREFAVANAEATFIPARTPAGAKRKIEELDQLAQSRGRDPKTLKKLVGFGVVIGSTEEEAKRKQQYLFDNFDFDALRGHLTGGTGVDYFNIPPGTKLKDLRRQLETSPGIRGDLHGILDLNPDLTDDSTWDEAIVRTLASPGQFAGTPEQIADLVEEFAEAGVDGFNVTPVQTLGGWWAEWVDHVVPILQQRGLAQREYTPGTLRKKLTGSDKIGSYHRAHQVTIG